jgi:hypothetical protein
VGACDRGDPQCVEVRNARGRYERREFDSTCSLVFNSVRANEVEYLCGIPKFKMHTCITDRPSSPHHHPSTRMLAFLHNNVRDLPYSFPSTLVLATSTCLWIIDLAGPPIAFLFSTLVSKLKTSMTVSSKCSESSFHCARERSDI